MRHLLVKTTKIFLFAQKCTLQGGKVVITLLSGYYHSLNILHVPIRPLVSIQHTAHVIPSAYQPVCQPNHQSLLYNSPFELYHICYIIYEEFVNNVVISLDRLFLMVYFLT